MIDFSEELQKFTPSEEIDTNTVKIDSSEESDMVDILMELLKD